MNWINIHTDTLRTEEFLGAEPRERATWLSLLAWCCGQENGGVIEDCKQWKDRMWQQLCGVTKEEVETTCLLFGFEANNLVVSFYPFEAEETVKKKRANGKLGGRPKKATSQLVDSDEEKPRGYGLLNHEGSFCLKERKGKERKGKDKEKKEKKNEVVFPFDSDQFKTSWNEWIRYLKQKRKTPTQITIDKQLKTLSTLNEENAILTINNSIQNGWQGLFPSEKRNNSKSHNGSGRINRPGSGHGGSAGEGINVPIL